MTIHVMLLFAAEVRSYTMYCHLLIVLCSSDIDECSESDSPVCNQTCTNTIGSYNCSCMTGYELNMMDLSSCDGKNSLLYNLHYKEHTCTCV